MIHPGSLVLFKNKPVLVTSVSEGKPVIALGESESKKVREKDLSLLHPGPLSRMPSPRIGGDFDTAYEMLLPPGKEEEEALTTWKDLSELVFGEYLPDTVLACLHRALEGGAFKVVDGSPVAAARTELAQAKKREGEREKETSERIAFAAWLRSAVKTGSASAQDRECWPRYCANLEKLALGLADTSTIAAEAGIKETKEAAHKVLIDSGLWPPFYNPWPQRAGCTSKPPRLPFPLNPRIQEERLDLRGQRSYAIDSAWSKDPDDAVAFDGERIWVHIADPSAFIAPNSEIDAEAMTRGATLYIPERIVPMLPLEAVERLGLGLAEVSYALSFGLKLDFEGSIIDTIITPSFVQVERLSYEEADERLQRGDETLKALESAAALRRTRRLSNGAVDIELPEVSLTVENDKPRFIPISTTLSSVIVREMMLLAGEGAARWAWDRGLPFVYSSQEAPQLPDTLSRFDDGPGLLSVQYRRRKGMKAGSFGPEHFAHRGLGLSFYSQVTSPLRRYQDLLAHHQIRTALSGGMDRALPADELGRRCFLAGRGAASTRQAERDSRLHWTICHLKLNPGWRGKAIVLDARDQDAWTLVPELGLESPVRTRSKLEDNTELLVTSFGLDLPGLGLGLEIVEGA
ncbi:MAG: ribonuclease catalytic domain-containing protein [Spirochaetes bacterium]|nr:ribonuclease catalytic domain-containing protein [Spirochaetota bacterium]